MSGFFTTRAPVQGLRGAICTSNYLATEAGMRMLRRGGNCIDAIIAAAAVLNVVEPHASHLGGDLFMLVWDAKAGKLTAINSSGVAPRGLRAAMFGGEIPLSGFLSSTIPGEVAGWDEALRRFGTVTPAEALEEAIHYAEEGFPVSRDLAAGLAGSVEKLSAFPSSLAALMPAGPGRAQGQPLRQGEILRQPDLARTLRTLADESLRAFYEGRIARQIAGFWQANGGVISEADLAAHRATVLEPLQTTYRGHTICEQPPVSQGHILLQALNIVERYELAVMGYLSPAAVHLCLEANKLAHADKDRYTTDPRWSPLPRGLLSKAYASERAGLIDAGQAMDFPPEPGSPPAAQETTYLCCVDGEGNAVSFIQSVFHGFGCGAVAEGTGVVLNNRGCGFSLDPGHVNFLEPGKKTVHTLNTYMILRDGKPVVVAGTPGGDIQVQTNLQVVTGLIDFGLDPQQACEMPRWSRHEGRNVALESRAPAELFAGLRERGHEVQELPPYGQGGRAQAIRIADNGALVAGSDPRCDGCALAF